MLDGMLEEVRGALPVKYSSRHLVVLIDGTWVSSSNKDADQKYSNVYRLNLYLDTHNVNNESQIAFYLPGLGSLHTGHRRYAAGIFAEDLPLEVERAYINICSNYMDPSDDSEGDKIYLFGFSRGAVIARLVASLICEYGLLHASKVEHFRLLWDRFIGGGATTDQEFTAFRAVNCHSADVEFLGVFDSVYGLYRGRDDAVLKSIFLNNRALPARVKQACHVLALDETRGMFQPVLWNGEAAGSIRLEQIWMPGVHSDVGGGYPRDLLSRVALHAMLDRIRARSSLLVNDEMMDDLQRSIEQDYRLSDAAINEEREGSDIVKWGKRQWNIYRPRLCDMNDSCQFQHPICRLLAGQAITYKSEKKKAIRPLYVFKDLPYAADTFFDSIK